jgi:hypothetical protein
MFLSIVKGRDLQLRETAFPSASNYGHHGTISPFAATWELGTADAKDGVEIRSTLVLECMPHYDWHFISLLAFQSLMNRILASGEVCDKCAEPVPLKGILCVGLVNWRDIDDFLSQYGIDPRSSFMDANSIRQYIRTQVEQSELTTWTVVVISQGSDELGKEPLGIAGHPAVNTISRTRLRDRPHSIGVLSNPATPTHRCYEDSSPLMGADVLGATLNSVVT